MVTAPTEVMAPCGGRACPHAGDKECWCRRRIMTSSSLWMETMMKAREGLCKPCSKGKYPKSSTRPIVLACMLSSSDEKPFIPGVVGAVCPDAVRWYYGYTNSCLDTALPISRGGSGYTRRKAGEGGRSLNKVCARLFAIAALLLGALLLLARAAVPPARCPAVAEVGWCVVVCQPRPIIFVCGVSESSPSMATRCPRWATRGRSALSLGFSTMSRHCTRAISQTSRARSPHAQA